MGSNLTSCAKEGDPSLAAGPLCLGFTSPLPLPPDSLCSCPALGQEEKAAHWCPEDAQHRVSVQGPNPHTAQPLPASSDPTAQNSPASPPTPRLPSHRTIPPTASGKSALPLDRSHSLGAQDVPLTGATASSLLGFQVSGKLPEESSSIIMLPAWLLSGCPTKRSQSIFAVLIQAIKLCPGGVSGKEPTLPMQEM